MSITPIIFLLTFIVGILCSIAQAGAYSFYLYQFVYFLFPPGRWWGHQLPDLPYAFVTSITLIAAVLLRYPQYGHNRLFAAPQTKWLVGTIVMYAIVSFYAINPELHRQSLIDFFKVMVIMAFAYKLIDSPQRLILSIWVLIVGAAYLGWEAFSVGRDSMGRVEGIGTVDSPEANSTAAAMVPAVPLLMYLAFQSSMKMRVLAAFLGFWIVNGLVLINSRGAFLAIIGGAGYTMFFMLFSSMQRANQRLFVVVLIAAGLSGGYALTDDVFWERMSTLQEIDDGGKSGSHRTRMWMSTFDLVDDYPAGVGANGFQTLSPIYVDEDLFFDKNQTTKAVHSSWFQALAELGWVGLILLLGLVSSCYLGTHAIKRRLKAEDDAEHYFLVIAIEAGLMAYLIAGTFIDQYRAQILYWMILYCACAYNIFYVQTREDQRD